MRFPPPRISVSLFLLFLFLFFFSSSTLDSTALSTSSTQSLFRPCLSRRDRQAAHLSTDCRVCLLRDKLTEERNRREIQTIPSSLAEATLLLSVTLDSDAGTGA